MLTNVIDISSVHAGSCWASDVSVQGILSLLFLYLTPRGGISHHRINHFSTGNVPQRQLQMAAGGPPADSLLRKKHHGVAENTFMQLFSQIQHFSN